MTLARYKFENYLKEIYMDSDTKVALLSSAPFDDPSWYLLFNNQLRDARAAINNIAGTQGCSRTPCSRPARPAGWTRWTSPSPSTSPTRGRVKAVPDRGRGLAVPARDWRSGTVWASPDVDRKVDFKALRAENARRCGL